MNNPDARPAERIASPCLGVCVIDARNGACYGCFRTPAEIADWMGATEAEKRNILRAIAVGRKQAGLPDLPGDGSP